MQGLWDNHKSCNMCLMGNQKEERKEQYIFETVTKNFSRLMSDTKPEISEVQRTSRKINDPKNYTQAYRF